MRRLVLGSLFAAILSMGLFTPLAGASESHLGAISKASIIRVAVTGPMTTIDWKDWLKYILVKYFGSIWNHQPKGSVPIPGTLLLFAGGFAGLVIWRARHSKN